MTYRSADQFQLHRQGRRHGKDGLVAYFFVFSSGHSCGRIDFINTPVVLFCRQRYIRGFTVSELSRSGCRLYLERALLAWLGFVQPVNVGLYFMAGGTAEAAQLGATWKYRVMFSVRVAETVTLRGVAPLNLAVAEKMR